ncbi:MAG: 30S ribosomal protein S4 [Candidatus Anstonellaceae archaeon]
MGDPRKLVSIAETPRKIWNKERIEEESLLKKEYGLKNTTELWISATRLKKLRRTARKLLSLGEIGEKKGQALISKLKKLGIAKKTTVLEDILALSVRDFLERRLQTIVLRKGLARTQKQARQLIVHGFIAVNGRRVTIPSYFVTAQEEPTITYFKPIDISLPVSSSQSQQEKKDQTGEKKEN